MKKAHGIPSGWPGILVLAWNGPAAAHSFGQTYTLPIPFWLYAWAGAATLVVSFVLAGCFIAGHGAPASTVAARRERRVPAALIAVLQSISLLGLALCIVSGFFGTQSVYNNFNMTFFWVIFVLGFAYFTALAGDWYGVINPWRALATLIAAHWPRFVAGRFAYPPALAYWPALALFAIYIWIELLGRSTPRSLAIALSAYTALNLVAVWLVGAAAWFRHGEFFGVFLRLLARLAPVDVAGASATGTSAVMRLRRPLSGLLEGGREHFTLLLFCLFMLSSTVFDGLHEARPWVRLYWQHLYLNVFSHWLAEPMAALPVLFKLYAWWQTAWLLISPWLYLAAYLAAIWAMDRLTGRRHGVGTLAATFVYSLLPIVLVYHVTHYYTLLQIQGIRIVPLLSDPLGRGWNLFGTAHWFRGVRIPDIKVVWHVQVVLILAGHVASVVVAHLEALRLFGDRRTAVVSQLPMLALMVAFTVAGLWILSLPFETPPRG